MSDERLHQDELVSAYLDGEMTATEMAEIETSDALQARVEEFRAVRDAVGEPVTPLSADRRDDLIGAALGAADAEAAGRPEASVVRLRRPPRLLLAMAAAVTVLAAAVGTGLLTGRGGDEQAEMAADAPADVSAEAAAAPMPTVAPGAGAESMAEMDTRSADEATADEAMAAEELMEDVTDAVAAAEATTEAALQAAEAAADEMAAPAEEEEESVEVPAADQAPGVPTTTAATSLTAAAAEPVDGDDLASEQVVDLGPFESLESMFDQVEARRSAALEDGATAEPGACSSVVNEHVLESGAETLRSFVGVVGSEDPVTFDARLALRDDGTAVIVHASPPDCEIRIHELLESEGE